LADDFKHKVHVHYRTSGNTKLVGFFNAGTFCSASGTGQITCESSTSGFTGAGHCGAFTLTMVSATASGVRLSTGQETTVTTTTTGKTDESAWSELNNQFCQTNWAAAWSARTVEPLAACQARCDSDSSCTGITVGTHGGVANNCVKCSSVASTTFGTAWTTHAKQAWNVLDNRWCSANWGADWAKRTVEPLASCKASCEADPSCAGITVAAWGGVADNCVKCSSVASTGIASGWTTHVKPVAWSALSNQWCNTNWGADWAARTAESLASCQASCEADSTCPGITVGAFGGVADICVKCSSVASTGTAAGWTTHVRLRTAETTTTIITTTAMTTTTTTTTSAASVTTTTTTATSSPATTTSSLRGTTTTTAASTTANVASQLFQLQEEHQTQLLKLGTLQTLMAAISSLLNSTS